MQWVYINKKNDFDAAWLGPQPFKKTPAWALANDKLQKNRNLSENEVL